MWVLTDNGDGTSDWTWIENDNVISQDLGNSGVVDSGGWTTDEFNNPYRIDSKGNVEFKDTKGTVFKYDSTKGAFVDSAGNAAGGELSTGFLQKINNALGTKITTADLLKLGVGGAGTLMGLSNLNNPSVTKVGYQGTIPEYTASQPMLTAPPEGRRPGSGGINYGTGVQYKDAKGNIVSDTSTSVADLLAAAKANPFNEKQTDYGIKPTPNPLAPPTVRAPIVSAAQQQTINNKAAADKAAADAAALKAAQDAAALKAAQDAAFAKTPEGMAQKLGKTLPAGWGNFDAKAKIDWFNKNNIDPTKLLSVGVSQADIDWMSKNGYNAQTVNQGIAAGVTLPTGWNNLDAKGKIDYLNKNNVGIDALTKAGTSATDIQWMKDHGYTGNANGVQLPAGFENKTAQQKIDYFNQNNVGIDKLLQAGTSQADIDWMKNNGYTGNAAGVSLPAGFENKNAQQKIEYFNQNNIGADKLLQAGTSQADIDWMRDHGYRGYQVMGDGLSEGRAGVFNFLNQTLGSNPTGNTNQVVGNGSFGDTPEDFGVLASAPAPVVPAAAPAPVVPAPTPAPLALPTDWGVAGGKYGDAQQKIDYFNQNNVSAAQLANQGVSQADIDWMKDNGYTGMAAGGLAELARGGSTGRYLQGETDGMADKIPTTIDGGRPAALSHGEFVIPADVVSHLGNGNSDAGAKKLYNMMDKLRMARTGTKKQGKQINPDKFMPGGLAALAGGGKVLGFDGTTGSSVPAGTTGVDQTLAGWTGNYVPNMLGKAQALSNTPYQAYTGPLTAGASGLQKLAFENAASLPGTDKAADYAQQAGNLSYTPQTLNFDSAQAKQYMNPYLQQSLDPQIAEARRQSEITALQNNANMTKAGAFGGGRQAILTSENQRNLGTNLANITGQGYNTAYTNAMGQFNADQNRQMNENQFGSTFGLNALQTGITGLNTANQMGINTANAQAGLGAVDRGIQSEGIAADRAQFEEARKDPYTKLQFQQSMLNGLPISATNYTSAQPSTLTSSAAGIKFLNDALKALGVPGY